MKLTIQNVDLNVKGFTLIDLHPEVVAIRGNDNQVLGVRGDNCVKIDAPEFLIRGFLRKLAELKVPYQTEA